MGLKNNSNFKYKVSGVGTSIKLDERQTANIVTLVGGAEEQHDKDYITIALGATNGNPWSRSNYWMHEDTIKAIETGCAWSNSVTYEAGDIVSKDGHFHIAKGASTNQDPLYTILFLQILRQILQVKQVIHINLEQTMYLLLTDKKYCL